MKRVICHFNFSIHGRPSQLCTHLKSNPGKNSGMNGIQTQEPAITSATLYQLSYQASWEQVIM